MARKVGNFKPNPNGRPITAEDLGWPWFSAWPAPKRFSRVTHNNTAAPTPERVPGAASPTAAARGRPAPPQAAAKPARF